MIAIKRGNKNWKLIFGRFCQCSSKFMRKNLDLDFKRKWKFRLIIYILEKGSSPSKVSWMENIFSTRNANRMTDDQITFAEICPSPSSISFHRQATINCAFLNSKMHLLLHFFELASERWLSTLFQAHFQSTLHYAFCSLMSLFCPFLPFYGISNKAGFISHHPWII